MWNHNYGDIIDLPHHQSKTRPQMSMRDRAAQFSAFKALTGHEAALEETARLIDARHELCEDDLAVLDKKLRLLMERLPGRPEARFTYFVQDSRKDGGAYLTVSGEVRKIDVDRRMLMLDSGVCIPLDDIILIEDVKQ